MDVVAALAECAASGACARAIDVINAQHVHCLPLSSHRKSNRARLGRLWSAIASVARIPAPGFKTPIFFASCAAHSLDRLHDQASEGAGVPALLADALAISPVSRIDDAPLAGLPSLDRIQRCHPRILANVLSAFGPGDAEFVARVSPAADEQLLPSHLWLWLLRQQFRPPSREEEAVDALRSLRDVISCGGVLPSPSVAKEAQKPSDAALPLPRYPFFAAASSIVCGTLVREEAWRTDVGRRSWSVCESLAHAALEGPPSPEGTGLAVAVAAGWCSACCREGSVAATDVNAMGMLALWQRVLRQARRRLAPGTGVWDGAAVVGWCDKAAADADAECERHRLTQLATAGRLRAAVAVAGRDVRLRVHLLRALSASGRWRLALLLADQFAEEDGDAIYAAYLDAAEAETGGEGGRVQSQGVDGGGDDDGGLVGGCAGELVDDGWYRPPSLMRCLAVDSVDSADLALSLLRGEAEQSARLGCILIIALDTEWRPVPAGGRSASVPPVPALLQLATEEVALLIDLLPAVAPAGSGADSGSGAAGVGVARCEAALDSRRTYTQAVADLLWLCLRGASGASVHVVGFGLSGDFQALGRLPGLGWVSKGCGPRSSLATAAGSVTVVDYGEPHTSAWAFAGRPSSLAGAVRRHLSLQLRKDEQISNWERRPLRGSQLDYAVADVTSLVELERDRLAAGVSLPANPAAAASDRGGGAPLGELETRVASIAALHPCLRAPGSAMPPAAVAPSRPMALAAFLARVCPCSRRAADQQARASWALVASLGRIRCARTASDLGALSARLAKQGCPHVQLRGAEATPGPAAILFTTHDPPTRLCGDLVPVSAACGLPRAAIAKHVLLAASGGSAAGSPAPSCILVSCSTDCTVDVDLLRHVLCAHDKDLAPDQVSLDVVDGRQLVGLSGFAAGSVTPFGLACPVLHVVDASLVIEPIIVAGVGWHSTFVAIPATAFVRATGGLVDHVVSDSGAQTEVQSPRDLALRSAVRVGVAPAAGVYGFLMDGTAGRLVRWARVFGLDAVAEQDGSRKPTPLSFSALCEQARTQGRLLVTQNRKLASSLKAARGCCIAVSGKSAEVQLFELVQHSRCLSPRTVQSVIDAHRQALEGGHIGDPQVARRLAGRCVKCNSASFDFLGADEVTGLVPAKTRAQFASFHRCRGCNQVFWSGSYVARTVVAFGTRLLDLLGGACT